MGRRSYNPERTAWRGRSYRKGGEQVVDLRVKDSSTEDYDRDMSNQVAKVIAGPHVLYTGSNGKKTAGVTVESTTKDEATCKRDGFKFRWDINTTHLQKPAAAMAFGLSEEELRSMVDACLELEK